MTIPSGNRGREGDEVKCDRKVIKMLREKKVKYPPLRPANLSFLVYYRERR